VSDLRILPLEARHEALGARFGEFAGWRMPLWYGGALEEHLAVRNAAGVFDISHMGRYRVDGEGAASLLASAFTRDPERLANLGSCYGLCCNEQGGIVDDILIYRLGATEFFVICNAANAAAVGSIMAAGLTSHAAKLTDVGPQTVLLAIQGPRGLDQAAAALGMPLDDLARHTCREMTKDGATYFIARGGYTGEDGVEVMTSPEAGGALLDRLIAASVVPCGLASRDTLRLEAALPLHGHDIDETTLPWEAGLGWAVELDHEFTGREALASTKDKVTRRLACLLSDGQGIFRSHQDVYDGDEVVGTLASGGFSPMLNTSIAMTYLPRRLAREGTALSIDLRGRRVACHVVKRPFYTSPDLAQKRAE